MSNWGGQASSLDCWGHSSGKRLYRSSYCKWCSEFLRMEESGEDVDLAQGVAKWQGKHVQCSRVNHWTQKKKISKFLLFWASITNARNVLQDLYLHHQSSLSQNRHHKSCNLSRRIRTWKESPKGFLLHIFNRIMKKQIVFIYTDALYSCFNDPRCIIVIYVVFS